VIWTCLTVTRSASVATVACAQQSASSRDAHSETATARVRRRRRRRGRNRYRVKGVFPSVARSEPSAAATDGRLRLLHHDRSRLQMEVGHGDEPADPGRRRRVRQSPEDGAAVRGHAEQRAAARPRPRRRGLGAGGRVCGARPGRRGARLERRRPPKPARGVPAPDPGGRRGPWGEGAGRRG
jgi:hypothetical protein